MKPGDLVVLKLAPGQPGSFSYRYGKNPGLIIGVKPAHHYSVNCTRKVFTVLFPGQSPKEFWSNVLELYQHDCE